MNKLRGLAKRLEEFQYIWWDMPRFVKVILIASAVLAWFALTVLIGSLVHPTAGMIFFAITFVIYMTWMSVD